MSYLVKLLYQRLSYYKLKSWLTVKMKMTVMSVTGMMILAMMAAALVHLYLIHIPKVTGATSLQWNETLKLCSDMGMGYLSHCCPFSNRHLQLQNTLVHCQQFDSNKTSKSIRSNKVTQNKFFSFLLTFYVKLIANRCSIQISKAWFEPGPSGAASDSSANLT